MLMFMASWSIMHWLCILIEGGISVKAITGRMPGGLSFSQYTQENHFKEAPFFLPPLLFSLSPTLPSVCRSLCFPLFLRLSHSLLCLACWNDLHHEKWMLISRDKSPSAELINKHPHIPSESGKFRNGCANEVLEHLVVCSARPKAPGLPALMLKGGGEREKREGERGKGTERDGEEFAQEARER